MRSNKVYLLINYDILQFQPIHDFQASSFTGWTGQSFRGHQQASKDEDPSVKWSSIVFLISDLKKLKNKRLQWVHARRPGCMCIARPTSMAGLVAQASAAHPSSLVEWCPSSPTYSWLLGTLNLHPLLQDGLVNLLEAISKRPKMRTLLKKTLALMMPRDLSTSRQQLLNPSTVEEIDTSTNRDSIPMAHYQDGGI